MTTDRELYYGDFERDGEEAVRNNLALGRYQNKKGALAREWIARKDQSRNDASQAEQIAIARSAADAAWDAARAAKKANNRATIALLMAAISIAVSIIGLFAKP